MSDPDPETPLIRAPSQQTAVNIPAAQGGRNSRAYKIAGITLLACVLIVGQAMVAYFLLSQRSDIKSLEEQSNNLKAMMAKGKSVSVPVRMDLPMNAMPKLMVDTVHDDSSTELADPHTERPPTNCELEAAGVKRVPVPDFRPKCDGQGRYKAMQCFGPECWCVNPENGQQVPGSVRNGKVNCMAAALPASLSAVMQVP